MELRNFEAEINRVAWSLDGVTLGVSTSDGFSYVFKENEANEWNLIEEISPNSVSENSEQ